MSKRIFIAAIAVSVPVIVGLLSASALASHSAPARPGQSGGQVIVCTFKKISPARPPAKLTETDAGRCVAFGVVSDAGTGTSKFTLVGNPPNQVRGTNSFTGKQGTISGRFQGPTAPIAFKPGPKPTVLEAVAIAKFTVVSATGAYAVLKGKVGVSAAHANNATNTTQASIILP